MANPQPDKFTRLSNEILDHLISYRISGREWQILLAIIRKTYGFNKKSDCISMSQFAQLTGMTRPDVAEQVKKLLGKNLIGVTQNPNRGGINSYIFQKDWESWEVLPKTLPVTQKPNTLLPKSLTEGVTQKPTYKRHNTKDNNTKDKDLCAFDFFWKEYPRKIAKSPSRKAWIKLMPSAELVTEIMAGLQRHKETEQWNNHNGKYIPHASTWLNGRRWEDELIGNFTMTDEEVREMQEKIAAKKQEAKNNRHSLPLPRKGGLPGKVYSRNDLTNEHLSMLKKYPTEGE